MEGFFFVLPAIGPSSPSTDLEVINSGPTEYVFTF